MRDDDGKLPLLLSRERQGLVWDGWGLHGEGEEGTMASCNTPCQQKAKGGWGPEGTVEGIIDHYIQQTATNIARCD